MKLSILSSVLLLGSTAMTTSADGPLIFGRSMRQRSSPITQIHHYGEDAARKVGPRRWSKTSKASNTSPLSPDGMEKIWATKAPKKSTLSSAEVVKTATKTSRKSASPAYSRASRKSQSRANDNARNKSVSLLDSNASKKSTFSTDKSAKTETSTSLAKKIFKKAFKKSAESTKAAQSIDELEVIATPNAPEKSAKKSIKTKGPASSADLKTSEKSVEKSAKTEKSASDSKAHKKSGTNAKSALLVDESKDTSKSKSSKKSLLPTDDAKKTSSAHASEDAPHQPKISKTTKMTAQSEDTFLETMVKSMSMSYVTAKSKSSKKSASLAGVSGDTLKQSKASKKMTASSVDEFPEDMIESISMSYSNYFFEDSMAGDPSATIVTSSDTDATGTSRPELSIDFDRVTFEYIRQCAGVTSTELEYDNCMVSKTIHAFMNVGATNDGLVGGLRYLQTSNRKLRFLKDGLRFLQVPGKSGPMLDLDEECYPLEATELTLLPLMNITRDECIAEGSIISESEFNRVFDLLLQVLSNTDCERSLCTEGSTPSVALLAIIFDAAAECANVDLQIEQCAMDHMLGLMASFESEPQDSEPCEQPEEAEFQLAANFLVISAKGKCEQDGITMTPLEWDLAMGDLVKIFTANQCWGIENCDDGSIAPSMAATAEHSSMDGSIDFENSGSSSLEDAEGNLIKDDGSVCIFETYTRGMERYLELSFFYAVETLSDQMEILNTTLEAIGKALIYLACSEGSGSVNDRRPRILQETKFLGLDSSPKDVVSTNHNCNPETKNCNVIEGKVTLIVNSDSKDNDGGIKNNTYLDELAEMFVLLPGLLINESGDSECGCGDSNVVALRFIGTDASAYLIDDASAGDASAENVPAGDETLQTILADDTTAEETPNDNPTIERSKNSSEEDSEVFQTVLIAASGSLIATAILLAGFRRMQTLAETEEGGNVEKLDEKSHGSNDGQSTAYLTHYTADLTCATSSASCDTSDISSLASPARSLDGTLSPDAYRSTPAKFFVVAEEEEENWRDLSILPHLAQDDGTLEEVSEEGEFINSVSSQGSCNTNESHGEMSV